MAFHIAWYVENKDLETKGVDILILIEKEMPTSQIEEVFGPKFSKNGYRYDKRVFAKVVKMILELYTRVVGECKVTNGLGKVRSSL